MTCYNAAWKGRTRLIWCDTQCRSNWAWQIGLSLKYWITCPPCKVWPIPFKSWPSILAFLGLIDLVARGLCSKLLPLIHKNVLQAFLLARLGCPQNMESCVNFDALQSRQTLNGIQDETQSYVYLRTDLRFVKKFTRPNFWAKNFTH